jgi:hypothetical protein
VVTYVTLCHDSRSLDLALALHGDNESDKYDFKKPIDDGGAWPRFISLLMISSRPNLRRGEGEVKPTPYGTTIRLVWTSSLVTGRQLSVLPRYPSKS